MRQLIWYKKKYLPPHAVFKEFTLASGEIRETIIHKLNDGVPFL